MDDLAALLLQIEWGADEALADAPAERAAAPALITPRPPPAFAPRSVQAGTLAELRAAIAAFDGCALRDTASHPVFAEGDPGAALLLVCDPPGADDDRSGRVLSGPEGAYLDRMLASIGLSRADVLIAPLIPWRPPGGRPPSGSEIAQCLPFLHALFGLARPRLLATMGTLAARTLFGGGRDRARGWTEFAAPGLETAVPALAMPSPAMLLRTPARRRDAWADLRRLRRALNEALTRS